MSLFDGGNASEAGLTRVRTALLITILSIFGAHALTYFLVGVLPDAAVVSLGLDSVRREVVEAFHTHGLRSYPQVLADLAGFNLGKTLDGIPVTQELWSALASSAPRVLAGFLGIILICILTAFYVPVRAERFDRFASFVAFLPPYVAPFIAFLVVLVILLKLGGSPAAVVFPVLTMIAIAAVPGALIAAQTINIMRRNLESDFARTLLAVGAKPVYQRTLLFPNVIAELVPSLEKVFTGMVAALLFAEPILGVEGFGTMAIRAVRRADPDLLLGITLVLSIAVGGFRLIALLVRRHYGLSL